MSEKEFKVGDFVRMKHFPFEGQICQITSIKGEGMYLTDRCSLCTDAHFEPIDPKTAFLHDLSELLRKYDANINFGFSVEERTCGVLFDIKDERIFYPFKVDEMEDTPDTIWRLPGSNYPLTPDNVLNYDK